MLPPNAPPPPPCNPPPPPPPAFVETPVFPAPPGAQPEPPGTVTAELGLPPSPPAPPTMPCEDCDQDRPAVGFTAPACTATCWPEGPGAEGLPDHAPKIAPLAVAACVAGAPGAVARCPVKTHCAPPPPPATARRAVLVKTAVAPPPAPAPLPLAVPEPPFPGMAANGVTPSDQNVMGKDTALPPVLLLAPPPPPPLTVAVMKHPPGGAR